eukprot:3132315-Rhodomonas_salina.1
MGRSATSPPLLPSTTTAIVAIVMASRDARTRGSGGCRVWGSRWGGHWGQTAKSTRSQGAGAILRDGRYWECVPAVLQAVRDGSGQAEAE